MAYLSSLFDILFVSERVDFDIGFARMSGMKRRHDEMKRGGRRRRRRI